MSTPPVLFVDAQAAAVSILDAALTQPVRTRVPNPRPAEFVRVERLGGTRRNVVTDEALISVEAWAATEQDAHDLAQLARGWLHAAQGSTVAGFGTVYRVDELGGPAHSPDPESGQERFTFSVQLALRATH